MAQVTAHQVVRYVALAYWALLFAVVLGSAAARRTDLAWGSFAAEPTDACAAGAFERRAPSRLNGAWSDGPGGSEWCAAQERSADR